MTNKPTVVIAMSGGVDSSVAAALLVEQGYRVLGMMLRLWSEPGCEDLNRCCTPEAMSLAQQIAVQLNIPFYVLDAKDVFQQKIVQYFVNGYAQGVTPNPCLQCNRHIRFGFLLEHARAMGADFLATGHYARTRQQADGTTALLRGLDPIKDQSYVLSVLKQGQLKQALFPIGEFPKTEVRAMAHKFNLPVAERSDSQDLCFLAGGDYRDFLRRNAPQLESPGPILDHRGNQIGDHQGLAYYTIGQRKGLGIAAPQPLYVLAKDSARNALIVGIREESSQRELIARQVNWISGQPPAKPFHAKVKIRYQSREVPATVTPLDGEKMKIQFEQSLRDITPGQAAVVYQGENVLCSGIIQSSN